MNVSRTAMITVVLTLSASGGLWAQRGGMGMMGNMPSMPGLQNPAVGSGAEYIINSKGKEMDVATVVLGKEDVEGSAGYWMEQRVTSAELGGEMVMKSLTVVSGSQVGVKRMIIQRPGQPPMEMPAMMMSMMQSHQRPSSYSASGPSDRGELVGSETVTVPAGTFVCQHYRKTEKDGPVDVWISTSVSPYAVVKMTGSDMSMELKKSLANETSHIKGEPQQMQFPGMQR